MISQPRYFAIRARRAIYTKLPPVYHAIVRDLIAVDGIAIALMPLIR